MKAYWLGFYKKAVEEPSLISDWLAQEKKENKSLKDKKKDNHVDPRELSEWITPDVWYSSWPTKGYL